MKPVHRFFTIFAISSLACHGQDQFNVNLYGYGAENPNSAWSQPDAQATVKLTPDDIAGAPGFASGGWQNVFAKRGTNALASVNGATAQLNLLSQRNASPYHWTRTRDAATHANPNAAMLDGKSHGTFDPGDGSLHSILEVGEIPYAAYDVVIYFGINQAQRGNDRGRIRIHDGDEQRFTLLGTEPDGTLIEITDADTPGNFLISRGHSGTTLRVETWGDGFNHLGPAGFQIVESDRAREPLEITDFQYNRQTHQVTLTWTSFPGDQYGIYWSQNLEEFRPVIHPAVPAHETATRTTFGPFPSPVPGATRESFKIGPPDLVPPELERIWGNNRTIQLTFSEPLTPATALDAANYGVTDGRGGTVAIESAAFHADRNTVVLTTAAPLAPAATYRVAMRDLTDLALRPLIGENPATFRTWDNNPRGVQVFILAGQSNMVGRGSVEVGHGREPGAIGSLRHLAVNDPANYSRLLADPTRPAASPWAVRGDVKVWWNRTDDFGKSNIQKGDLGAGLASTSFGPELGFGWQVGDFIDEPVLLIKAAWGGKSLFHDFRPPSAAAKRGGEVGHYYLLMLDQVRQALDNLDDEFPEWFGLGYRIAGFGWHQGWNDCMHPIPAAEYEANLADFIHDLRGELGHPQLPIAIAATGHGGSNQREPFSTVLAAQLAVADPSRHPAVARNVTSVDTRPFWREPDVSPANDGSHWNANGQSYFLIGKSIGDGMVEMLTR